MMRHQPLGQPQPLRSQARSAFRNLRRRFTYLARTGRWCVCDDVLVLPCNGGRDVIWTCRECHASVQRNAESAIAQLKVAEVERRAEAERREKT